MKTLSAVLNRENHNLIHLQIVDFAYYQVPLASLLSALLDQLFAVALRIPVVCTEVAAAKENINAI